MEDFGMSVSNVYVGKSVWSNARWFYVLLLAWVITAPRFAQATVFIADFSVSGFEASAPVDPVTGQIGFTAATATGIVESVLSVSLTIDGYAHSLSEVGHTTIGSNQFIGGILGPHGPNGVCGYCGVEDFQLQWRLGTGDLIAFKYATELTGAVYSADVSSSQFSIQAVPEPSTLALLGLGLASIRFSRRQAK
jgi:hypothetical protein